MYKIAICGEDHDFIDSLNALIVNHKKCPKDIKIYLYNSGEELVQNSKQSHNLIFLEIQMRGIDGKETARRLREKNQKGILVFFSDIQWNDTDIFKVRPYRYLLKQFKREKLLQELSEILDEMVRQWENAYLPVYSKGSIMFLPLDEILYISRLKRGCQVFSTSDMEASTRIHLDQVYERLESKGLEFAHNSYIVNIKHVKQYDNKSLKLSNGSVLNISRSKSQIFKEKVSIYLSSI